MFYSPNSFPAMAVLIERLVVGPGCRANTGRPSNPPDLLLFTWLGDTYRLFDGFLLELHLSWEVLQFLLPWSQMSSDERRWSQMIPDELRWSQMMADDPKWWQMIPRGGYQGQIPDFWKPRFRPNVKVWKRVGRLFFRFLKFAGTLYSSPALTFRGGFE